MNNFRCLIKYFVLACIVLLFVHHSPAHMLAQSLPVSTGTLQSERTADQIFKTIQDNLATPPVKPLFEINTVHSITLIALALWLVPWFILAMPVSASVVALSHWLCGGLCAVMLSLSVIRDWFGQKFSFNQALILLAGIVMVFFISLLFIPTSMVWLLFVGLSSLGAKLVADVWSLLAQSLQPQRLRWQRAVSQAFGSQKGVSGQLNHTQLDELFQMVQRYDQELNRGSWTSLMRGKGFRLRMVDDAPAFNAQQTAYFRSATGSTIKLVRLC